MHLDIPFSQHRLLKRPSFLHWMSCHLKENYLSICTRIHFRALYFILSVYLSVIMPWSHCVNYCSFFAGCFLWLSYCKITGLGWLVCLFWHHVILFCGLHCYWWESATIFVVPAYLVFISSLGLLKCISSTMKYLLRRADCKMSDSLYCSFYLIKAVFPPIWQQMWKFTDCIFKK